MGAVGSTGRPGVRFPLFDSLRAIAALSVFAFHASGQVGGLNNALGRYVTQRTAGFPTLGVAIFFAISGFLLYRPFVQARHDGTGPPPLRVFARRRLARVVPAYWLALAVTAGILGQSYVFTASGIANYFGFLQLYHFDTLNRGIAQAWTLGVELTFYAALAAIAWLLARRPPGSRRVFFSGQYVLCVGLIAGSVAWQVAVIRWVSPSDPHFFSALLALPGSFDLLGAGMLLAVCSVAVGERRPALVALIGRWPGLAWALAAAAYWALVHSAQLFPSGRTLPWVATHELRALLAVALLLPAVFGDGRRGLVRRLLSWRPLCWVGVVSYGFYLWHGFVLVELHRTGLHAAVGGAAFLAVALLATCVLAAVSWYGLERRVLRRAGAPGTAAQVRGSP